MDPGAHSRVVRTSQSVAARGLAATGLLLLGASCGGSAAAREPTDAEILWDTFGVPHVYAEDERGLFRGLGWAQMHGHGNLILQLYARARGRAAEIWGEELVESDRWVRTMAIPARARDWYAAQEPDFRELLDAFAAGMNAYAAEFPERFDARLLEVLPVDGSDVLAHQQRVTHFSFLVDESVVSGGTRALGSGGSNAWAIAPARTEAGHALLLANPHLPWSERFLLTEAHLVAPGIDLTGAALVGFPVLVIAFNDQLGWTHTINTHDGADVFELSVEQGAYRFDGALEPFAVETESLLVARPDGGHDTRELTVRSSVHGPVIAEQGERALALRVAGLDRPHCLRQWWEMGRARDLQAFEAALALMQIPTFTVIYADRAGNILHLFGGLTPVRPGPARDWSGAVPGDTSETLWNELHSLDSLPRVLNPGSGWLQNCNDPPWTTTVPAALDPADYPAYLAPRFMHLRAQRSARMLMGDERISFDELVRYKHSTRVELADRLLDDLVPLARRADDELLREAGRVLDEWDRHVDADSRGAVLFLVFAQFAGGGEDFFAEPWDESRPVSTPRGLADADRALAVLAEAARSIVARGASLDVSWGDVFRLQQDDLDLPCSGGMGQLGIFRVFDFTPVDERRNRAVAGETFVAAIEFADPVRAQVLLTYGNATQPGSPHRTDQLPLAARQELRPALRERAAIEAALESREWVPRAR